MGGAAISYLTDGMILSGDFDFIVPLDGPFEVTMAAAGFRREDRLCHLKFGWYHPDLPRYGFQVVSGPLFDGRADAARLLIVAFGAGSRIGLPSTEDLIADRLAQFAASGRKDHAMCAQAELLFRLGMIKDSAYLRRRIIEESGEPGDIGLTP